MYDVAHRHHQALDPSALNNLPAAVHALGAAIEDCRNAGKPAETDPAVLLLARRVGFVAEAGKPSTGVLRQACMDAVAEIRRHPALLTLAAHNVPYDQVTKKLFHSEGRLALRRLADALELDRTDYDLRSHPGGVVVSGEITLHSDELYVQLALGGMNTDREVMFRRVKGRHDYLGDRNHWASVRELLAPARFASRLRRELRLSAPPATDTRLFA